VQRDRLSGLITPSLDEMVHVASEMKREGFTVPLLIGGATTSKVHTAVKIAPQYGHPVVYVPDASRVVNVVSKLISEEHQAGYAAEVAAEYEGIRELQRNRQGKDQFLTLAEARANPVRTDWSAYTPPRPTFLGLKPLVNYPLEKLVERIDWTPFFATWQLNGLYPEIFDDAVVGAEAKRLFDGRAADVEAHDRGPLGAGQRGVRFLAGEPGGGRRGGLYRRIPQRGACIPSISCASRCGSQRSGPNVCLADYVAPKEGGKADYLGLFAVTAGLGIERR
jgi:5-methyltetrahydrofolate--homocysteine methyltransferase